MKSTDRVFVREGEAGEAPAELAPPWFGRSLTLPCNALVRQRRCKHVCRGGSPFRQMHFRRSPY